MISRHTISIGIVRNEMLITLNLILMDHYTQMSARLNVLKAYPIPSKANLSEMVSLLEAMIESSCKIVSVPFTIEDCEDLRDGGSFEWEFN